MFHSDQDMNDGVVDAYKNGLTVCEEFERMSRVVGKRLFLAPFSHTRHFISFDLNKGRFETRDPVICTQKSKRIGMLCIPGLFKRSCQAVSFICQVKDGRRYYYYILRHLGLFVLKSYYYFCVEKNPICVFQASIAFGNHYSMGRITIVTYI